MKNAISQVPGALSGKNPDASKVSPRKCAFFYIFRFGRPDPHGQEIAKYGGLGHFGLGRPLALKEIPGGKQKNANSHIETEKRETNPLQLGPNTQS